MSEFDRLKAQKNAIVARQTFVNNQRVWDLLRYQRSELHEAGLINDEEYAVLAQDHAAVERLETYDAANFIRQKAKAVLNFYDIQMNAVDPAGRAMFHAAMEELRTCVKS